MTTCRDIITQSMRRVGVLPLAREAKAAEAKNGLFILQDLYDNWFASGVLGEMEDVYKTTDYTANEFERIFADGATITLPETIPTEENPNELRTPKDLAIVQIHDGADRRFVWDGGWVETTNLTLESNAPLAGRGQDGLASALAVCWVDTFGGQLSPAVIRRANHFNGILLGGNATKSEPVESF